MNFYFSCCGFSVTFRCFLFDIDILFQSKVMCSWKLRTCIHASSSLRVIRLLSKIVESGFLKSIGGTTTDTAIRVDRDATVDTIIRVEVVDIVRCYCRHGHEGLSAVLWGATVDTPISVEVLDIVGCYCMHTHYATIRWCRQPSILSSRQSHSPKQLIHKTNCYRWWKCYSPCISCKKPTLVMFHLTATTWSEAK